jgi:hypothetical protein
MTIAAPTRIETTITNHLRDFAPQWRSIRWLQKNIPVQEDRIAKFSIILFLQFEIIMNF